MNRIILVAMGDSLTAGYQSLTEEEWTGFTPYTIFLEHRLLKLNESQQKKKEFQIRNRGVLGELTSEMLTRFDRDALSVRPDFVIILGGSNDIGWGISPREIFGNLSKMYEATSKNGIEIIACSVPSILGCDSLIPPRLELNEMIRTYCTENGKSFADLFRTTADPRTNRLREEFSDDGLHLSTAGYEKIAETIFDQALKGLLSKYYSSKE